MSFCLRGRCMYPGCECAVMHDERGNSMCTCGHVDAWHVNYGTVDTLSSQACNIYADLQRVARSSRKMHIQLKEELELRSRCIVCMDAVANVVILPCRHANVCAECSTVIANAQNPQCPTCRTPIRRRVRYLNTNTI